MEKTASSPLRLALVYGSNRPGRFADVVGAWATERLAGHPAFSVAVADPARIELPGAHRKPLDPAMEGIGRVLEEADAFLILVPEYNHSFPAALKFIIDSFYAPWALKPVAFVAYGGISGGIRAVEHLRQVFAELNAVCVRNSVLLPHASSLFDAAGSLRLPAGPNGAFRTTLDQLEWWARRLRAARQDATDPFPTLP